MKQVKELEKLKGMTLPHTKTLYNDLGRLLRLIADLLVPDNENTLPLLRELNWNIVEILQKSNAISYNPHM